MNGTLKTYSSTDSNGANLPDNIGQRLLDTFQKRQAGRASTFSEEKAMQLLETIMDGSTVQQACDTIGISRTTFYTWRSVVPELANMVALAHELQADSMVDDSVRDLSDVDTDGREAMARLRKAEQVARFKFDLAKCLNFKKYGDKRQSLNVNLNADVPDADVSRWFNK